MSDEEKKQKLRDAGWRFSAARPCKVAGCTARVEYWIDPGKKGVVLDYIGLRPHWSSCAGRKAKQQPKPVQTRIEFK